MQDISNKGNLGSSEILWEPLVLSAQIFCKSVLIALKKKALIYF